jgi:glycosyltransferase involved in cell wall biosynthesis
VENLSKRASLNNRCWDVFNPGLVRELWKFKGSVVIVNGWTYSSTLLTIFFAKLFGKKVWLRAENPLNQEMLKTPLTLAIKKTFLKHILFRAFLSKCLYIGTESRQFFEYYGVAAHKLVYTPYAVDNDYFSGEYKRMKNDLPAVRAKLGLPADKKIILFSGKYITKKRPLDLLRAFHAADNLAYALVMVGDGDLRQDMERYISDNGLQNVYLTGFINQSVIPAYYAVADVFVMCSGPGETWGLSVNEAMNFEKPVLVSKTCGSCADLVDHGVNGFAFEEGNIGELASYLQQTLDDPFFQQRAGIRSAGIIRSFSIGHIVENLVAALP